MNPTIDYLIFSDAKYELPLPGNVRIVHKSLAAIGHLAAQKLQTEINLTYPYKLCDFKPAYGYLFEEYLVEYDFWGHGDLDVVYGIIRDFITDDLLEAHELISVRHDFLSGYFLLFRNNGKMRTLFMQSKDFKKVFASSRHFCFDETNFAHDEMLLAGKRFEDVETEIDSMMHVVRRMEKQGRLKVYWDTHILEGTGGQLKWRNGQLIYKGRYEILLYHLIHFNQFNPPSKAACEAELKEFNISSTRFYNLRYHGL